MICKICKNIKNNKTFRIREMMFGFRDEFTYFECSECGCLQIAEIPKNMEKYYPLDYYSFQPHAPDNLIVRLIKSRRNRYVLFRSGFIGKLLYMTPGIACLLLRASRNGSDASEFDEILSTVAKTGINRESHILDVGCGSGGFLGSLRDLGTKSIIGVDPYIDDEVTADDIRIFKKTIHDLPDSQKFDLIIFNHSFEHIPDQLETLLKVANILTGNGVCLIRMPLKTERIWDLYGVDWVQIDAPRHFIIHTMKSFEHLVAEAGLAIKDVVFDSTAFQLWGSEQYKKDIPLEANNSYRVSPGNSMFTPMQIREFGELARQFNATGQGDQAAFYLTKTAK